MKITLDSRKPIDVRADLLVLAAGKRLEDAATLRRSISAPAASWLPRSGIKASRGSAPATVALFQTHGALAARYSARRWVMSETARATPAAGTRLAQATVTRARDLRATQRRHRHPRRASVRPRASKPYVKAHG